MSCTQCNIPDQDLNQDHSIQGQVFNHEFTAPHIIRVCAIQKLIASGAFNNIELIITLMQYILVLINLKYQINLTILNCKY